MSTVLAPKQPKNAGPMELIRETLLSEGTASEKAAIIKELVALQQSMERFQWECEERQAKIDFDDALNRCQRSIGRIAPNQQRNDSSHAWWADYAHLDATIRPIYTAEGLAISYSEAEPLTPGKIRMKATVSKSGTSKDFFTEITPTTTGAKGNAVMNATDADAAAGSRAMRYLLIKIFNIAVGIDKAEKQTMPEAEHPMNPQDLQDCLDALKQSPNSAAFEQLFHGAHAAAKDDLQAHLTIDLFAIKEAPVPETERAIFKLIYAKRNGGNTDVLKAIVDAHEAAKKAFAKGGAL